MIITPYTKNAKKHPPSQIKALSRAITAFGFSPAIEVDKEGVIISGHGRYLAATELGLSSLQEASRAPKGANYIPYVILDDLTPTEVKQKRLADNKLAESDIDMILAVEELKDIQLEGGDITLTGYDQDLLLEGNEADDEVPEAPKEPQSKLGDIYELGQHRVMCGDATETTDVMLLVGDRKVDMYLTDPPYNVSYVGKTKDALTIENDTMDDASFRKFLAASFLAADTVMKAGAVFYVWHADSEGYNFRGACGDVNWKVRQCLIWNKNVMVMGRQDYHWKHEPCLYGWKEGASHLWNSDRTQTTMLNFDRPTRSTEHPTMKPVELISYQITNNTKGEDIVLDTFLGSGSTLIAAQKTGRICYGLELSPSYTDVIVQRYVDYTGNTTIIKNGQEIQWQKSAEKAS